MRRAWASVLSSFLTISYILKLVDCDLVQCGVSNLFTESTHDAGENRPVWEGWPFKTQNSKRGRQNTEMMDLDSLDRSDAVLVHHLDDVVGGGHYQSSLHLLNACIHHRNRLVLCELRVPHLVKDGHGEHCTCTKEGGEHMFRTSGVKLDLAGRS